MAGNIPELYGDPCEFFMLWPFPYCFIDGDPDTIKEKFSILFPELLVPVSTIRSSSSTILASAGSRNVNVYANPEAKKCQEPT